MTERTQTTLVPEHLRGFSRAELRRRACMYQVFAEQAGRDLHERRKCERIAAEFEEASRHAK